MIAPSLGRNLANNAATVNLIEPGTIYGDRVNEIALRIAKILKVGRTRTNIGVDIYNLTNAAPVLTYNQAFVLPSASNPNGSWLTPTSVLQPRFFKISAQIDFYAGRVGQDGRVGRWLDALDSAPQTGIRILK